MCCHRVFWSGASWMMPLGQEVLHSTVRFKKIYNPGDRPRSMASYRMSTQALPGKTHCELEEIFRAKAGKMATHSR